MKRQKISKTDVFENLPVKSAVIRQVVPAIISQMIMLVYNLADTYFVGQLNDPAESAAVSVAMPIFLILTALSNLFGVGGASNLSQALGRKEIDRARDISSIAFWMGVGASLIFSLTLLFLMKPMTGIVGATAQTYAMTRGYLMWSVVIGGTGAVVNMLLANIVRAAGEAGIASIGVSIGGILNVILDPVFIMPEFLGIKGLGMGAVGAGLATGISNLVGAIFFITYIIYTERKKNGILTLEIACLRRLPELAAPILKVGLPSAIQYALTVVAASAITKFTSSYGTEAVAALGITKKIDMLPLYFSIGTANGLLPILAYNHGSGNQERRKKAFTFGCAISLVFSCMTLILYEIFAVQLASLFIDDPATIEYSAAFLRRLVVAQPLVAMCYPMIVQFQAMSCIKESLICSIIRKGVIDIPLLFLMDLLIPLYGLMWVQPIVDTVALVIALICLKRVNNRIERIA